MTDETKTGEKPRAESSITDANTLGFLLRTAEQLNATLDLDAVLHGVAHQLKTFVDYDTFAVLLLDELGKELRFRFGVGFAEDVLEHWRFGLGQGLVGNVAQTCKAIRVDDVTAEPRYINAVFETGSELAIPLIAKQRMIGVLDVQSRERGRYTEYHQQLLTFLAGHLANAIENARLYTKLQEQARAMSLMTEAARELTAILDFDRLLNKLAALLKRSINYQVFTVMLWDESTQQLEHRFSLKFDERFIIKGGFTLGQGLTGTAAALRQAIRVPNVDLDPRYLRCGHQVEVRSEMVVPLVFKDRLIGVVDLESTDYNAFSHENETMLTALASYIAIAIENARLYERLSRDEKRLATDLETAREIQKRLLPTDPPQLAGVDIAAAYEPARQLGGDFYDFLPYGEGRVALAAGDVAGKGAAAALQGSLAIGLLREHVMTHPCDPAEMLTHMNTHLIRPALDNRFIAMAFAVYDTDGRTLTLANGGFPRPHLIRSGGIEEIPAHGVPLGVLDDGEYEQLTLDLQPGDLVVFCSDGLHECRNARGEEFGDGRLQQLLLGSAAEPARVIADRLLHVTDEHAASSEGHADDRTVVVLKVS